MKNLREKKKKKLALSGSFEQVVQIWYHLVENFIYYGAIYWELDILMNLICVCVVTHTYNYFIKISSQYYLRLSLQGIDSTMWRATNLSNSIS